MLTQPLGCTLLSKFRELAGVKSIPVISSRSEQECCNTLLTSFELYHYFFMLYIASLCLSFLLVA